MASIRSQLSLNDGMSAVLKHITKNMQTLNGAFVAMQRSCDNAMHIQNFQAASEALGVQINLAGRLTDAYGTTAEQVEKINQNLQTCSGTSDEMLSKIESGVKKLGAAAGLKKLVDISDASANTTARIGLLVQDGGSVTELESKIMASAQDVRAAYLGTANAVAKLGLNAGAAFSNNDEIIAFMAQVNKQFVIGGASAQEQSAAMHQLTQAMAAGTLRGEELNSILDSAPGIARAIESYMGVAEGSIKKYAEEGLITSEVVKNAIFSVADEINSKFERMPLTWGQVWTIMGNIALQVLNPVLSIINWLANNLSIIGPLVLGIGSAFLVFQVAAHWSQIAAFATSAYHAAVNFLSIGFGVLRGSTAAASAATMQYNSALLASPITWIIMIILAVIALLYAVVEIINKVTGSTTSATGLIVGALTTAVAFIWNLFLGLLDLVLGVVNYMLNPWIAFANFFGNLFNDPVGAIIHLFGDLADNILGVVETIAKAIDKVIGSNLAGAVQGWREGLDGMVDTAAKQYGNGSYEKIMDELNLSSESLGLSRWAYSDAWDTGYNAGQNLENSIGEMFGFGGDEFDYSSMASNVSGIAENTEGMADALEVSSEQLEYLRDIAEREAVNRFTTAEVKIDMTGMTNRIDGSADLDGVLSTLTDGFAEALVVAAEGVHA